MNAPVCRGGVDQLMEYLENTLPPDARAAITTHVGGCPKCMAFLASYIETPRIVREATSRPAPASLQETLLAALRANRQN